MLENYKIAFYLPVLLISGLVTGILIGIVAQEVILRLHMGGKQNKEGYLCIHISKEP